MASPHPDPPEPLYPNLRGRKRGSTPEQVAHHQRERLIGAMIEAVARRGYKGVTVSEVVALAGVSKSAFYAQFADKEACFLATFEAVVELGAEEIEKAYRGQTGFREGMEAAFAKFVELVDAQGTAARVVLVDSLSLGVASLAAREKAAERYETMIRQSFEAAPLPGSVSPVLIRAIFGGLRDFAYHCLRDGEPQRLKAHIAELIDWGVSYREAAAAGPGPGARLARAADEATEIRVFDTDPEGEVDEPLSWEEPANSERSRRTLGQRERIMRATAQVAAAKGYGALTMPAIAAAAGTSNQTFYEFFASKEKAFLAAFDAIALRAFEVTGTAFATRDNWLEAGATGIKVLLEYIAEDRLFRQINFFELYAAGPAAHDRAEAMLALFTAFMQPDPLPPEVKVKPSKVVIEAIAGGIWATIQHEAAVGRSEDLPQLLPDILDFVLLPFAVE